MCCFLSMKFHKQFYIFVPAGEHCWQSTLPNSIFKSNTRLLVLFINLASKIKNKIILNIYYSKDEQPPRVNLPIYFL